MGTRGTGLREKKKQATREALRAAALRLAIEHGPDNVRVDDIAEAAGVAPRTYNNYFSSREQAIVDAVMADRESAIAAAVSDRSAQVSLAGAVIGAVVSTYALPDERTRDLLVMITTSPALRESYAQAATSIEKPLARAIRRRADKVDELTAEVLAACIAAAVRVALREWLQPASALPSISGFVVPSGSLPDLLHAALAPVTPALDAVDVEARGRS